MLPLALDTPRVDITHSAAAAFCGLPCVIAKLRWNTPYLLTEHGVYLREQYLNIGRSTKSPFVRWFLFRLVNMVVSRLVAEVFDLLTPHADLRHGLDADLQVQVGPLLRHLAVTFNRLHAFRG